VDKPLKLLVQTQVFGKLQYYSHKIAL